MIKLTRILNNEKGMALITVYLALFMMTAISGAAFGKSYFEMKQMDREVARVRSFAAAEAAVQNAMAQIGLNGYTGFINTTPISVANFQDAAGTAVGNYSATLNYPNQADWITVKATATVDGDTRNIEARIFLDSNLSKYLVYANTGNFSSGAGAQYGASDGTNPEGVSSNADDRASMYFTGDWTTQGGVTMYGDVNAVSNINGDSTSVVHGDVYTGDFATNSSGAVTASGVAGSLKVGDGFTDDKDRNNDAKITSADYPDYHQLNSKGGDDSHKTETLTQIDNNFYKNNNNISAFGGVTATSRYLKFVSTASSTATTVQEYNSTYTKVLNSYTLPSNGIVYVNGNAYVQGEIGGRVSVVSSNSIYFDGNVTYSGGQSGVDENHSTAFMAKDKLYFRANSLSVSGILYAQNSSNSAAAFDADYNTSGVYDPGSKVKLDLNGNRIINGSTNLSDYPTRNYGYDKNLKYFRPPGIPVVPALKTVREA